MALEIPVSSLKASCTIDEIVRLNDLKQRRLYLYGEIFDIDMTDDVVCLSSVTCGLAESIMEINREDDESGLDPSERKPIRLFINSPGGNPTEGFVLIDAIRLSKTPVWTINMGQCSSMAFLISIAGHKRFTFPSATFLLHDGTSGAFGSSSKVQDRLEFEKRYEQEIVKKHVLACSRMSSNEYNALARVEFYMLPEDAMGYGFVDEIITDISAIL